MEEAGVIIESVSLVWPVLTMVSIFITFLVVILIKSPIRYTWILIMFALIFSLFLGVLFSAIAESNYQNRIVSAIEDKYDVSLLDSDGEKERGIMYRKNDHQNVGFRHEGELFTDARLDIDELEDGSMQFVLLFNPNEDTDKMTEFSSELLSNSEGADTERMGEVSTS